MNLLAAAAIVVATSAQMQAAPAPLHAPPSPMPMASLAPAPVATGEDPTVTKIAIAEFAAWQAGKVDSSRYTQPIPDAAMAQVHTGLATLGTVKSVTYLGKQSAQGVMLDRYRFDCMNGSAIESIYVQNGKIAGIFFAPAS